MKTKDKLIYEIMSRESQGHCHSEELDELYEKLSRMKKSVLINRLKKYNLPFDYLDEVLGIK